VASAVEDAVGVSIEEMPLTPSRLRRRVVVSSGGMSFVETKEQLALQKPRGRRRSRRRPIAAGVPPARSSRPMTCAASTRR
jgi:hypothetical protein